MYQLDLNQQLKTWMGIGLYGIPIAIFIFSIFLKCLANYITKVTISYGRAIVIQLVASFSCWLFMLLLIYGSQFAGNQVVWKVLDGLVSIFIGAVCYSQMIIRKDSTAIGMREGLKLSALLSAIALFLLLPTKL